MQNPRVPIATPFSTNPKETKEDMEMKVYKNEYKAPEFLLLPLGDRDILTDSLGVQTPTVDEEGVWRTSGE